MAAKFDPPRVKGRPIVGNVGELRRDRLGFFLDCARKHGTIVRMKFGPREPVLISDPALIEQVLVTENRHFVKSRPFQLLQGVLGDGLVTSSGALWLRQRRLMQPAFHRGQVEAYAPIVVGLTERTLAQWRLGQTFDLHAQMMQLTLAIVAKALLDVEMTADFERVGAAIDVLMEDFVYRLGNLMPIPKRVPTPWNRRVQRTIAELDQLIYGIIADRRGNPSAGDDLLSRMMRSQDADDGSAMSDRQLRDEVITLLSAGHETTATALAWTWYLLGKHPQVESRLRAELQNVLGGRTPTVADVPRLQFVEQIIMESMRLYPPVFAMGRMAKEPCVIGGFDIPKGTAFLMSQWVSHRDPKYFDAPEEFRPERWADERMRQLPKFAYYPFGGGPRLCIGAPLAMLEAVLIVATVAQRFRFELVEDHPVKLWPCVTLRPRHGIKAICRSAASTSAAISSLPAPI
ncbi:MAG TPA: cytochrome P450 [Pirellulales bacterium]|jgi:cytochrome P450|nr:cytochrome P450 [Pirellulales bacterium]